MGSTSENSNLGLALAAAAIALAGAIALALRRPHVGPEELLTQLAEHPAVFIVPPPEALDGVRAINGVVDTVGEFTLPGEERDAAAYAWHGSENFAI